MATGSMERKDIQWKELLVIAMAAVTRGHCWAGKRIMFHGDNQAVCDIWRKGSSGNRDLMDLVRSLYHIAVSYNSNIIVVHIPGVDNSIADSLSRLQMERFRRLVPEADAIRTPHKTKAMAECTQK